MRSTRKWKPEWAAYWRHEEAGMQCPCGGATVSRTAAVKRVSLTYQACGSCGRVGGEELYAKGRLVATGTQARRQFQSLKPV